MSFLIFDFLSIPVVLCLIPLCVHNFYQTILSIRYLNQGAFFASLKASYEGYVFFQQLFDLLAKIILIVQVLLGQFPYISIFSIFVPFLLNYSYNKKDYHILQANLHALQLRIFLIATMILITLNTTPNLDTKYVLLFIPVIGFLVLSPFFHLYTA